MNIDEINDHFEIERLMIKYVEAIDNKDWNMLDEVFTEQAFLDYESSGGPEGKGDYPTIKKWLQKNLSMFPMTQHMICLLYTSPSPRDGLLSRMPSSA